MANCGATPLRRISAMLSMPCTARMRESNVTTSNLHASEKTTTLSWELKDGIVELALHHPPCNEIGTAMLEDLEQFVAALELLEKQAGALIIYSRQEAGFSAGADLRELY